MARWFQKKEEELPEKLRGKSEEDLIKAMDDAAAHKAALDAAVAEGTETKTKLTAATTEIETIKAKLLELENATPKRRASDNGGEPTGPKSVFVDEDAAFADRLGGVNNRVTVAGALAARMTTKEAIENGNNSRVELRIWNKYANEINTLMGKEHPDRQINPQAWYNAFVYVKGLHSTELLAAAAKKEDVFAEPGTGGAAGVTENHDEPKLSPQEIEIAKKFKMTPEKYLERKKAMKFGAVTGA